MSNSTKSRGVEEFTMEEYQFTCPECTQEIDVNTEMRSAILANGCPVCAARVADDSFDR